MPLSFALFSYSVIKILNSQAFCFVDFLINLLIFWYLSYYILWDWVSVAMDILSVPLYYSFSPCYHSYLLWHYLLDLVDSLHYPLYICFTVYCICIYYVFMGDWTIWYFWINVENAWFLSVSWLSFGNWVIFAGKFQCNNKILLSSIDRFCPKRMEDVEKIVRESIKWIKKDSQKTNNRKQIQINFKE